MAEARIFQHSISSTPDKKWVTNNINDVYSIIKPFESMGHSDRDCVYGEITKGAFQKIVDDMKAYADFNATSRFIDVGSGLGKPCLHVAQDPGVSFSFGIELSEVRWGLCINAFLKVLQLASKQVESCRISHKCFFACGDVAQADTFDPFTHVYMFNTGFNPREIYGIADKFNRSSTARYLICYINYKNVVEYNFQVHPPIRVIKTSMSGSNRHHSAFIYKRAISETIEPVMNTCDPLFRDGLIRVNNGLKCMLEYVKKESNIYFGDQSSRRCTRSRSLKSHPVDTDTSRSEQYFEERLSAESVENEASENDELLCGNNNPISYHNNEEQEKEYNDELLCGNDNPISYHNNEEQEKEYTSVCKPCVTDFQNKCCNICSAPAANNEPYIDITSTEDNHEQHVMLHVRCAMYPPEDMYHYQLVTYRSCRNQYGRSMANKIFTTIESYIPVNGSSTTRYCKRKDVLLYLKVNNASVLMRPPL
jgi:hypothetical protein